MMRHDQLDEVNLPERHWWQKWWERLQGEHPKPTLRELLQAPELKDTIPPETQFMLHGVLDLADLQIRDIMVPRGVISFIEQEHSLAEVLNIAVSSGHSRLPVVADDLDNIQGILLVKDLLRIPHGQVNLDWHPFIRPATFVPESKRLTMMLSEFRLNRFHMAIVVDEYGGTAGLVTIEDLIEEIIGDIEDEHDQDMAAKILCLSDKKSWQVEALVPLEKFNQEIGSHLSGEDIDTLAGYLMTHWGKVPKRDESMVIDGYTFRILEADRRRIKWVEVALADKSN